MEDQDKNILPPINLRYTGEMIDFQIGSESPSQIEVELKFQSSQSSSLLMYEENKYSDNFETYSQSSASFQQQQANQSLEISLSEQADQNSFNDELMQFSDTQCGVQKPPVHAIYSSNIEDDNWLCPICIDLFEDPVETPCCHNLFCKSCIDQIQTNCPLCGQRLGQCIPNIPIRRLMEQVSVQCTNTLCEQYVRKCDLSNHVKNCQLALVGCPYDTGCGQIVKQELNSHINQQCPRRPVKCQDECGAIIPFIEQDLHKGEYCPNVTVQCPQLCGDELFRGKLNDHIKNMCLLSVIQCEYFNIDGAQCKYTSIRSDMQEHKLFCNFRKVNCVNLGCNMRIIYQHIKEHDNICQYKIIDCPNQCGVNSTRGGMDSHINKCPLQQIQCSYRQFGCDSVQLRKDYKEHLKEMSIEHSEMMAIGLQIQQNQMVQLKDSMDQMKDYFKEQIAQIKDQIKSKDACNLENSILDQKEDSRVYPFDDFIRMLEGNLNIQR